VPELQGFARTIARWETSILAAPDEAHHSATEGTNLTVKNLEPLGFGFRNVENHRLLVLMRFGAPWQHLTVTPIRHRHLSGRCV
jgi:transposase